MIPLYKIYIPDNIPELNKILYSGMLSYSKWGRRFEEEVGNFIENDKFLVVNSYNSAMLVAITTLGLKPGDQIIASPISCLASNQPFITQNLKVVWADIDPNTGTLDPEDIKKKINNNTKVIFHNHHCGYVGYVDEISSIAKENGIFLVDDAIEAFGSKYNDKVMGNLGADITVFSFQTVRLPNTIDGGGLSFKDKKLFEKANLIRDLGVNRKKFRDRNGEISKDCDINLPGFGATISEVNSYIGTIQMRKIETLFLQQRKNANEWRKKLNGIKNIKPLKLAKYSQPNYWIFGCKTANKIKTILDFRKKGFYSSGVHLNNNIYSVFRSKPRLKGVSEFYNKFIALPCGWWTNEI